MPTAHDTDAIHELLDDPRSRALLDRPIARLAYTAADGTPRVVPIGFSWTRARIVICTAPNAPKVAALRRDPTVALTIDTEAHPPHVLLLRGTAELDEVDGVPDEYLASTTTGVMTHDQRVEWEAGVRSLYESMVRIVVTPTWAKLIDFDETLPTAVAELVARRAERATPTPSGRR